MRTIFLSSLLAVLTAWAPVGAADGSPAEAGPSPSWLALGETLAAAPVTETKTKTVRQAESAPEPPCKPPPLPLHSIEGVGGTLTVPTAYVCNPGHAGCKCSLPSASLTYLYAGGGKSLQTFAITQTFLRRIELGYALDRLDLGNFPHAISKATAGAAHIRQDLYMHNFNLRGMLLEENSFSLPWMPAVTAGFHFKYNTGTESIGRQLEKALGVNLLKTVGYRRHYGFDYTLTASKTIVLGRPFILSGTLRCSSGSNIGLTGFADECQFSFETHVICLLTDWLALAYEFRQKSNPYHRLPPLIGKEGNWHAILVGIILSDRLTLAGGWARLGELANTDADGAWGVQIKYEF